MASSPDETTEPQSVEPTTILTEPELPFDPASDRLLVAALYAAPMFIVILDMLGVLPRLISWWGTAYFTVLIWHMVLWTTLGRRLHPWRITVMMVALFIVDRGSFLFFDANGALYIFSRGQSSFTAIWFEWVSLLLLSRIGLEIRHADLDWDMDQWWQLRSLLLWTIGAALFVAFVAPESWDWISCMFNEQFNLPTWIIGEVFFNGIRLFLSNLFLMFAAAWLMLSIGPIRRRMLFFTIVIVSVSAIELIKTVVFRLLAQTESDGLEFSWLNVIEYIIGELFLFHWFYGFAVCGLWHLAGFTILRRRGFRMFWRRRPI